MDYITRLEERCKRFRKIIVEKLGVHGIVDVHNAGDLTAYDFRYLMDMDEIEKSPDGDTFIERADLAAKKKVEALREATFTNHVVISLDDFMAMNGDIERLKIEKGDLERKYENLKSFIESVHLPAGVIADGRIKDMDWYIEHHNMDLTSIYKVMVTVTDVDAKSYGY